MEKSMNQIQQELEQANELYMIKLDSDGLVILSQDNVARIEAMIKMDSSYMNASNADVAADKKKLGSSAYWFKQLKHYIDNNKDTAILKDTPKNAVYEAVCAVDRENSTHINADKVGRDEITARISNLTIRDFIKYLKNPKGLELINLIAQKTSSPNGKRYRTNLSFASKFCHYACFYLFAGLEEQDNYSIYDNVLKKVLPLYAKKFGINCTKNDLNNYSNYRTIVDEIIKKSNSNISRNGFDHLLWYYHKGRL